MRSNRLVSGNLADDLPWQTVKGKVRDVTDILIGVRRHRPRKARRFLTSIGIAIVVYMALRVSVRMLVRVPKPDVSVSKDVLEITSTPTRRLLTFDSANLDPQKQVLTVGGSPADIGARSGRLLAGRLLGSLTRLDNSARQGASRTDWLAWLFGRSRGDWFLRHVDDGIPGHQLVELAGLQAGAQRSAVDIELKALIAAQAAYDIGRPDPRTVGLRAVTRGLTIVSPLRGATGERLLVGRTFSSPGIIHSASGHSLASTEPLVRFVRPEGVLAFAAVGEPSMIGVVTGINEAGLTLLVHPIVTVDRVQSKHAQPVALIARDILENAQTTEQAVAVIESSTPLGSAIFVIASPSSSEAVVVERTPQRFGVRQSSTKQVIVDLLASEPLADEPESERNRRQRPAASRAARALELLGERPPRSATDVAALLRDRTDSSGAKLAAGNLFAIADPSADHVVIIDPAALVLWVGQGPGAQGAFTAFDLRHELRGEGGEPSAPADLEAADAAEIKAAQLAYRALTLLIAAQEQAQQGNPRVVKDLITRALLIAPKLPVALTMAAEFGVQLE